MLVAFEANHLSSDNWVLIIEYSSSVASQPNLRPNRGYLILQSGYSYLNQMPGNVLIVLRAEKENN
jgi:hypothetical protein